MIEWNFWAKLVRKLCRLVVCIAMVFGALIWVRTAGYDTSSWPGLLAGMCVFLVDQIAGDEDLV